MVQVVKADERDLVPVDIPGISVRACDPVRASDGALSAGFTEYLEPCDFEWTFDYNEVFFMLEGNLEIRTAEGQRFAFGPGDMGYIENGTPTRIVVSKRALFVHFTQPAWMDAKT